MGIDDIRAGWTLVSFLAFVAIAIWAYSGRNKKRFEEDAMLPLEDDQPLPRSVRNK